MPPATRPFKTGARRTPPHILQASPRYEPAWPKEPRKIVVPARLSMWGNDQFGDCVTAEEAAAIALYSVQCNLPEVFIDDNTVLEFCRKWGFLNGAMLPDVMAKMKSDGFTQDAGYKCGDPSTVDFANEGTLQAAIENGPVKIGIDASFLPQGAGRSNGWFVSGPSRGPFASEDHCVALWNHGASKDLFAALNTPMPAGYPATGYHLYTWNTVGVVDHAWLMAACFEAWLRTPTDTAFGPGPAPTPNPTPTTLCDMLAWGWGLVKASLAGRPFLLMLATLAYSALAAQLGCAPAVSASRRDKPAELIAGSTLQQDFDAAMDAAIAQAGAGSVVALFLQAMRAYVDALFTGPPTR